MKAGFLSARALFGTVVLASLSVWPALSRTGKDHNTTITVSNTNDSGPGSLRDAITNASSGDTITFSLATYPTTITLSSTLSINTSLTINGPGASNLAISGNNEVRVLIVASGTTVCVSDVTIENGRNYALFDPSNGGGGIHNLGTLMLANSTVSGSSFYGGGISNDAMLTLTNSIVSGGASYGGAVYNSGTLTLTNSTVSGIGGFGGGIYINGGTLTMASSTVSGDTPDFTGGGIFVAGGTVTLTNSTVFGNASIDGGIANIGGNVMLTSSRVQGLADGCGGIGNSSNLTLTDSTVSGSASTFAGGICNSGTLTLTNSTVSGNYDGSRRVGGIENDGTSTLINSTVSANVGVGIRNFGTLTLTNSTVSGNYGGFPEFSLVNGILNNGALTLKNTILANNEGGNCSGTGSSLGHNLSDDNSCSNFFNAALGDLNNVPAGLDPSGLQNNGGPTQTIALLPTSLAVNAIPASDCMAVDGVTPIATDERGISRPQGLGCDIGAYEYLAITGPAPTSGSTCNGAYNGTFNGNLTVSPGQYCVFITGGVTGNVQQYGGSFVLFQSQVGKNVQVNGGGTFSIGPGSTINGNVEVQNLPDGSGQNQICGATLGGNLEVQNNGSTVLIGANAPNGCVGNTVAGSVQIQGNWAATSVVGNTVGGNLTDQNNTAATQVFSNGVSGNLICQNNTTIQGGGNSAGKQKQGQCSGF